jgi:4-hydroxymandelate oxidase
MELPVTIREFERLAVDALSPEVYGFLAGGAGDEVTLADGGIRRGADVLKALALGARAVMVGRPVLWGLAAAGEAGAHRVLELLLAELDNALALAGAAPRRRPRHELAATSRTLVSRCRDRESESRKWR